MANRVRVAASLLTAIVLAAGMNTLAGTDSRAEARAPGLVVHEWGTFTSVAGPDGQAVNWHPLSEASDLPCFVRVLNPASAKVVVSGLPAVRATVRMETPVIYFYAPSAMTARVSVLFPQGLITEWYPEAEVPATLLPVDAAYASGAIHWPAVTVRPDLQAEFPREPFASHYYPARNTDAAPVVVGGQHEKFLFYRGLAGFPVTIEARVAGNGRIAIKNTGAHALGRVVLFRNEGGRLGYRVATNVTGETSMALPELGKDFDALATELTGMLLDAGLYLKEARAMVETWRDSWFEEGTRLIYLVPRADVDRILPLTVSPAPDEIARAFVGRVEIITPELQDEVEQMLLRGDVRGLTRCGRFLQPIVESIAGRPSLAGRQAQIANALRLVAAANTPEILCPAQPASR
jgi:hypothetical protein